MLVFVIMLPGRWVYKAMSLVASTRGLALMPAYAKNLLPSSVVSCPLEGEAPTIEVAVGYSKSNTSPILKLFLPHLDDLVGPFDAPVLRRSLGGPRTSAFGRHPNLKKAASFGYLPR